MSVKGGLLNATFGNATEVIISVIALMDSKVHAPWISEGVVRLHEASLSVLGRAVGLTFLQGLPSCVDAAEQQHDPVHPAVAPGLDSLQPFVGAGMRLSVRWGAHDEPPGPRETQGSAGG